MNYGSIRASSLAKALTEIFCKIYKGWAHGLKKNVSQIWAWDQAKIFCEIRPRNKDKSLEFKSKFRLSPFVNLSPKM